MSLFNTTILPFTVKVRVSSSVTVDDVMAWGRETYGALHIDWDMVLIDLYTFNLETDDRYATLYGGCRTEEDASYFTLRWAS